MKTVTVKSPGSCGEFIQGIYKKEPCLVSCPIDLYSTICIKEGPATHKLHKKAHQMLELVYKRYDISKSEKDHVDVHLTSEIPVAKGMASSTADIAGLARGLSTYYGLGLSAQEIAMLCADIEPTDNLMYESLNLFNHVRGNVIRGFEKKVEAKILVVEFKGFVNTVHFNKQRDGYRQEDYDSFEGIIKQFARGLQTDNLDLLGEACTKSAILNQKILYKPRLKALLELALKYGGHGVVTGHSGTVIGVLYSEAHFDDTGFMQQFLKTIPKKEYNALFFQNIIPGGLGVTVEEK